MYYSHLVKIASKISFDAHKDDIDKGGYPYIMHPYHLAESMDTEECCCVALLHDVIEDHGDQYSFELLEEMGMSNEIIEALKLMTHEDGVPYMEYIKEIAKNPIARKVKIADLNHNLDSRRIDGKITKKRDIYLEALEYLKNAG